MYGKLSSTEYGSIGNSNNTARDGSDTYRAGGRFHTGTRCRLGNDSVTKATVTTARMIRPRVQCSCAGCEASCSHAGKNRQGQVDENGEPRRDAHGPERVEMLVRELVPVPLKPSEPSNATRPDASNARRVTVRGGHTPAAPRASGMTCGKSSRSPLLFVTNQPRYCAAEVRVQVVGGPRAVRLDNPGVARTSHLLG